MMMSELLDDLLQEILCRVPATSLKGLRSTCKRWNRLINDRSFTRKHFEKAPKQYLILVFKAHTLCLININIGSERQNESRVNVCSTSTNLDLCSPLQVMSEASLVDPRSIFGKTKIRKVFHCDGLFLCDTQTMMLVVWNPCTGQTRWVEHRYRFSTGCTYALGSYQDNKSHEKCYKILCQNGCAGEEEEFEIYDMNTNTWRVLDVTLDVNVGYLNWGVSLKGKSYWDVWHVEETHLSLVIFDYATERFERLGLPHQYPGYGDVCISVVKEEKLSLLLHYTSKIEIWVSDKVDENKVLSWSMVKVVDLEDKFYVWYGASYLFDEEKKVFLCCDNGIYGDGTTVCIVGEDNRVRKVEFEVGSSWSYVFSYVPSLTKI